MYRLFTLLFLFVSTQAYSQEKSIHYCYFESGTPTLTKSEIDSLNTWFKSLPNNARFLVEGHADQVGSAEANKLLAQKRSEYIKSLLQNSGVSSDSIDITSFGEAMPIKKDESDEALQANRRVKITATYSPDTSTIWQLFQLLDEGYQTFYIDPSKDTMLKGEQGTFIKIPANAFRLPKDCNANVTIRLKEAYKTSDMLMANLSTTSNGQILETRGMTYLDALCGTTPLKLAPKKKITHVMPIEDPVADMKFFKGVYPNSDSTINWVEEKKADFGPLPSDLMIQCRMNNSGAPCRFFFCKIRRFFYPQANTTRVRRRGGEGSSCDYLIQKLQEMGLDYKEGLQVLFAQYNVSNEYELLDALKKEELEKTENAISSGEATTNQITNYVFQQSSLGWANCDFYSRFPRQSLITMKTNIPVSSQNRSFLVFKKINTILPPDLRGGKIETQHFLSIPKNEPAILVAFKYSNGQPYIATKDLKTTYGVGELDFRPVTIEELKTEIKKLNRG